MKVLQVLALAGARNLEWELEFMASVERQPILGGLAALPLVLQRQSLWLGDNGAKPPEATRNQQIKDTFCNKKSIKFH